jgi:hypothetical protein
MYFVAHEDDDLLFMNPDIANSIAQGNRVILVHVTAGDLSQQDVDRWSDQIDPPTIDQYWIDRERGVLNAYAYMALGANASSSEYQPPVWVPNGWSLVTDPGSAGAIMVDGMRLAQYDLTVNASQTISLVFMRLSDFQLQDAWLDRPGLGGQRGGLQLPNGSMTTLGCNTPLACPLGSNIDAQTITRSQLISVLRDMMLRFGANSVSAQDATHLSWDNLSVAADCGPGPAPLEDCGYSDYPDHVFSAYFVMTAASQAQAAMNSSLWLRLYRDYTISQEPPNLSDAEQLTKAQAFARQAVFDAGLVPHYSSSFDVDDPHVPGPYDPSYPFSWHSRQLDTRTLLGTGILRGRLRIAGSCLGATGNTLTAGSCDTAPDWIVTTQHQLLLSGTSQCIVIDASGGASDPATLGPCSPRTASSTLFLFANGQLRTQNARCLSVQGSVVAVDCTNEVANRHATGITPGPEDWTLIFDGAATVSLEFSHTQMSAAASYFHTFKIVNRNVCARESGGLYCASSNGDTETPSLLPKQLLSAIYDDQDGWAPDMYGATVSGVWQGATSTTVACGRGAAGVTCAGSLATSDYSDATGWSSSESYYDSIRYIDLYGNGLISVCGHGYYGVDCSLNLGTSWSSIAVWDPSFSAEQGWNGEGYGDTLQFADVDGDGRTDVCARGSAGMVCSEMMKTPPYNQFINNHDWSFDEDRSNATSAPDFSDVDPAQAWRTSAAYYGSIRLVDVNRDGFADACGRGPAGIVCAFSTGSAFERGRLVDPFEFTDALGWGNVAYGSTISFGDLDGDARIDVCGIGYYGVICAEGY